MKQLIKLESGKFIHIDSDRITVKVRREARKEYPPKQPMELVSDKPILEKLSKQFKLNAPTEQDIYEGYLSLLRPATKDDDEDFYNELCRRCSYWAKKEIPKKETIMLEMLTKEEWDDLSYDIAIYISSNVFTTTEKSFLLVRD